MTDYMIFALLVLGLGVLAVKLNIHRIKSNQVAEMRARGIGAVTLYKRPGETVREENQKAVHNAKTLKDRAVTAKLNDKGFDEDELETDRNGYYTTELEAAGFVDDKGQMKLTRARHVRKQSEQYKNQNIQYWKDAKVLDAVTTDDLISMVAARALPLTPEWTKLLDALFTSYKGALIKKDYKTFGEEALMISLDQNSKPAYALMVKNGATKEATIKGANITWSDVAILDVIASINNVQP